MKRAYNIFLDFCGGASATLIAFCAAIVALDVILRPFGGSLIWAFEVTELLLLYVTMLALPWLARDRGHISVDVLVSHLSPSRAARLDVCTSISVAVVCLVIAWWGALSTLDAYARDLANLGLVQYPLWISRIAIPFGFGLAAVEYLRLAAQSAAQGVSK